MNEPVKLRVKNGRAVCPRCGRPTNIRIYRSTVLINYPLFCKHCRKTTRVFTVP